MGGGVWTNSSWTSGALLGHLRRRHCVGFVYLYGWVSVAVTELLFPTP